MSKYGFNENEVRRTKVTQIDKDGFIKEEIYEGSYSPSDSDSSFLSVATMTIGEEGSAIFMAVPVCEEESTYDGQVIPAQLNCSKSTYGPGDVVRVLLYKGLAKGYLFRTLSDDFVIDGDAEIDLGDNAVITIRGDFTITNSGK